VTHLHVAAQSSNPGPISYLWTFTGLAPTIDSPSLADTNAHFAQAGTYRFSVRVRDSQGLQIDSPVDVVVLQTITTVQVNPPQLSLPIGNAHTFTATAKDQFGVTVNTSFTWSTTIGTINSTSGSLMAPNVPGNGMVTATTPNGVSGTAGVLVQSPNEGSVSFRLGDVKVYPIPFKSTDPLVGITFANLPPSTDIKVYSTSGILVWSATSQGENVVWQKPLPNRNGHSVASGVYFYRVTNSVSGDKVTGKLVIIK
jgi:hypothetical protein